MLFKYQQTNYLNALVVTDDILTANKTLDGHNETCLVL